VYLFSSTSWHHDYKYLVFSNILACRKNDICSSFRFNNILGPYCIFISPIFYAHFCRDAISHLNSARYISESIGEILNKFLYFHAHRGMQGVFFMPLACPSEHPPYPLRLAQRQNMLSIEFLRNFLPVGKNLAVSTRNFLPVGNRVSGSVSV
jgi:hypothetical protein